MVRGLQRLRGVGGESSGGQGSSQEAAVGGGGGAAEVVEGGTCAQEVTGGFFWVTNIPHCPGWGAGKGGVMLMVVAVVANHVAGEGPPPSPFFCFLLWGAPELHTALYTNCMCNLN